MIVAWTNAVEHVVSNADEVPNALLYFGEKRTANCKKSTRGLKGCPRPDWLSKGLRCIKRMPTT